MDANSIPAALEPWPSPGENSIFPGIDPMIGTIQAEPARVEAVEQMQRVLQRLQSRNLHDKYTVVRNIGVGENGTVQLVRERSSGKHYAVKLVPRGKAINEQLFREIQNHRDLIHLNIIGFKEIMLTHEFLAIVMEYASGGELFNYLSTAGRFTENMARFIFQQLCTGVMYCHARGICHRDLKVENTLLAWADYPSGGRLPIVKLCDFGLSKSAALHSQPKSLVGTIGYTAPEVLCSRNSREYDGSIADVWSCGVVLYLMLYGHHPFVDPERPDDHSQTISRVLSTKYEFPEVPQVSDEAKTVIKGLFELDPKKRMTLTQIMATRWFQYNLPHDLYRNFAPEDPTSQSWEDIRIIYEKAQQQHVNGDHDLANVTLWPPPESS